VQGQLLLAASLARTRVGGIISPVMARARKKVFGFMQCSLLALLSKFSANRECVEKLDPARSVPAVQANKNQLIS
jgi:hypothetical protein